MPTPPHTQNIGRKQSKTKLQLLFVGGCSELEELQLPCMETLVSLEALSAEGCVKQKCILSYLEEVEGVENCTWLEMLRSLIVSGRAEIEEPPSMETLVSFKEAVIFSMIKPWNAYSVHNKYLFCSRLVCFEPNLHWYFTKFMRVSWLPYFSKR